MSRRALQLLLMVLVLLVVSCGSDQSDRTVATTVTTGATDPAPSDAPVAGGEDVEVYLEEWFGLRSDLDLRFQSYFEELPAEAPQTVEFVRDFWLGLLDLMLAHADDLESIEPPPGVASEHQAYVGAWRHLFTTLGEAMAGFTDLTDFEGYHFEDLFSAPKLTADHGDALYEVAAACQALEQRLAEAGPSTDLGCPPVAAVVVEIGDEWTATPGLIPVGVLDLSIHNNPELQKQVAGALQAKAGALGEGGRFDEAISVLDEIVSRFGKASEPDLRLAAAWALGAKGAARGEQGRSSEALAAYDDSIALVGVETGLASLTLAGMAQVRRPLALAEMERWDEAIIGFDEVIQRFDGLGEPGLDALVAQAYLNKAATEEGMGRWRRAMATYGELIDRFADTRDSEVFEVVVMAIVGRTGSALVKMRWKKALALAGEASDLILRDKDPELLEAVPFASGFIEWVSQSLEDVREIKGEGSLPAYMLIGSFEEFARSVPGYEPFVYEVQPVESDQPREKPASDSSNRSQQSKADT